MGEEDADVMTTLRWGFRHYLTPFLVTLIAVAVLLPAWQLRHHGRFDATAVVTAQTLQLDLGALPRYGDAVFSAGEVADAVVARFGDAGDPEDVVPHEASVQVVQDSVVFDVSGHAGDATTAAGIANVAAAEFVTQLNKAGEGVGTFAVQSPATPPVEATPPLLAAPIQLVVDFVAGLVAAAGLVILLLVVRRPVIDAPTIATTTRAKLLGNVTLPRGRQAAIPDTRDMMDIVTVSRRLLSTGLYTFLMASPTKMSAERSRLVDMLCAVLQQVRTVQRRPSLPDVPPAPGAITVVEPIDTSSWLEPLRGVGTVVIAREGMSRRAFQSVMSAYADASLVGVVLVRSGRRGRSRAQAAPPNEDSSERFFDWSAPEPQERFTASSEAGDR